MTRVWAVHREGGGIWVTGKARTFVGRDSEIRAGNFRVPRAAARREQDGLSTGKTKCQSFVMCSVGVRYIAMDGQTVTSVRGKTAHSCRVWYLLLMSNYSGQSANSVSGFGKRATRTFAVYVFFVPSTDVTSTECAPVTFPDPSNFSTPLLSRIRP